MSDTNFDIKIAVIPDSPGVDAVNAGLSKMEERADKTREAIRRSTAIDPAGVQAGGQSVQQVLDQLTRKAEITGAAFDQIFNGPQSGPAVGAQDALQQSLEKTRGTALLTEEEITALLGTKDQGATAAVGELGHEAAQAKTQFDGLKDAGHQAGQASEELAHGLGEAEHAGHGLVGVLHDLLALVGLHQAASEALELAEGYERIEKRLALVTSGTEELEKITEKLFEVANASRTGFDATARTYLSVSLAAEGLGKSQEDALRFTELLNKSIAVSGAISEEAQSAVASLSFAFQNGAINGRQLQTVLATLPDVGAKIAQELGVSRTSLKELANQGLITGNVLFDAFDHAAEAIDTRFAKTPITIGQSLAQLKNNFEQFIGSVNESLGATNLAAQALQNLSEHAGGLTLAISAVSSIILVNLVGRALPALSTALLANPITAVTLVVAALSVTIYELVKGSEAQADATDRATVSLKEHAAAVEADRLISKGFEGTFEDLTSRTKEHKEAMELDRLVAEGFEGTTEQLVARLKELNAETKQGKEAFAAAIQPLKTEIATLEVAVKARLDYATAIKLETELRKQGRNLSQSNIDDLAKEAVRLEVLKAQTSIYKEQLGPLRDLTSELAAAKVVKAELNQSDAAYAATVERANIKYQEATTALLSGSEKAARALLDEEEVTNALIAARGRDADAIKAIAELQQKGADVSPALQKRIIEQSRSNELGREELKVITDATSAQHAYEVGTEAITNALAKHAITTGQAAIATEQLKQATIAGRDPLAASLQSTVESSAALKEYIATNDKNLAQIQAEIKLRKDLGVAKLAPAQQAAADRTFGDAQLLAEEAKLKEAAVGPTQELALAEKALAELTSQSDENVKLYSGALIDNTRAKEDNAAISGLSSGEVQLYKEIKGPQIEYARRLEDINRLKANGTITEIEAARATDQATISALQNATDIESGFKVAFAKIGLEATNMSAVIQKSLDVIVDHTVSALATTLETGKFQFKAFVHDILEELFKIYLRLLVVLAIEQLTGTTPANIPVNQRPLDNEPEPHAAGGPVQARKSYLVGERGPEVVKFGQSGNITANDKIAAQAPAPVVNLQVTNVTDPDDVPRAINSGKHDQAIINVLGRNKARAKAVLA